MRLVRSMALLLCGVTALAAPPAAAQESTGPQRDGNWHSISLGWEIAAPSRSESQELAALPADSTSGATSQPAESAAKEGAEALPAAEKSWEVKLKAYGWIPSIEGRAGVGPVSTPVDVTMGDVIDNLNLVEAMVPIDLEGRVGNWGAYADLLYVKLENRFRTATGVRVNVEADQTILEMGGFYRAGTWALSPGSRSSITLDVLGGARYNRIAGAVGLQGPHHGVSLGRSEEWWDPFVGPRVNWHATDKLDFFARGDVGGFGIDDCSHFVWQFIGGADYYFTKYFFAELGYRLLDDDFETGSGRNHFKYDLQMAGPYLALGVRF
jgi:hypothetical protein